MRIRLASLIAIVGFGDAVVPPRVEQPPVTTALPLRIRINATVQDRGDSSGIRGEVHIGLPRQTKSGERQLYLDLGGQATSGASSGIRVEALSGAGLRILSQSRESTRGLLRLRVMVTAADSSVLTVKFSTPLPATTDPSLGYRLWDARAPGHFWYPKASMGLALSDMYADYEATITHRDSLAVLLGGRRTRSTRDAASGYQVDSYAASDLEGLALVLGTGFRVTSAEYSGIQVNLFDRTAPDSGLGEVVEATGAALDWYVRRVGFFPHDAIGIVPGFARGIGGNPMPGIFTIHRGYTGRRFLEEMTAHELGHFYWGQGILGANAPGALNWLMLGNSIWLDQLYVSERRGIAFDVQWHTPEVFNMPERFLTAQVGDFEQRLGLTGAALDSVRTDYGGAIAHAKASMGILLLARGIGNERFLDLQRQLIRKYWHRELTSVTYAHELAQAGLADAPRWLSTWERGDARVGYQVHEIRRGTEGDSLQFTVVIARTGTIPAPLEVDVVATDGSAERRGVSGSAYDTVRVSLRAPLQRVVIDPDGRLPMASSGGWRVQGAFARAMLLAGQGDLALALARQQLGQSPQDTLTRGALVARLAAVSSFQEIRTLMEEALAPRDCTNRVSCQALGHHARALAMTGNREAARAILDRFDGVVDRNGARSEWRIARAALVSTSSSPRIN